VASGSLPPGLPADFYQELADLVGGLGVRLVLDASGAASVSAVTHPDER
jgi:6-phosphofructokinase 2